MHQSNETNISSNILIKGNTPCHIGNYIKPLWIGTTLWLTLRIPLKAGLTYSGVRQMFHCQSDVCAGMERISNRPKNRLAWIVSDHICGVSAG